MISSVLPRLVSLCLSPLMNYFISARVSSRCARSIGSRSSIIITQLVKAFGFDLADSLAGDAKLLADRVQGLWFLIIQTEAQGQDFPLIVSEGFQPCRQPGSNLSILCVIRPRSDGSDRIGVLDGIHQAVIVVLTHRVLDGIGFLQQDHQSPHIARLHTHGFRHFLHLGFAIVLVHQLAA